MCHKKHKTYALNTVWGRFQSATEGERGYVVYRSCTSKVRYNDENYANKTAKRKGCLHGEFLRAYYCRFCNGYHLTSKPLHDVFATSFVAVA